jgi:hypothetical protein
MLSWSSPRIGNRSENVTRSERFVLKLRVLRDKDIPARLTDQIIQILQKNWKTIGLYHQHSLRQWAFRGYTVGAWPSSCSDCALNTDMRDRSGPKTGEVTAIFGLPSFRSEWALWGITYPTFQIVSITSNKGTCEPVPNNLVTANWIARDCALHTHRQTPPRVAKGLFSPMPSNGVRAPHLNHLLYSLFWIFGSVYSRLVRAQSFRILWTNLFLIH